MLDTSFALPASFPFFETPVRPNRTSPRARAFVQRILDASAWGEGVRRTLDVFASSLAILLLSPVLLLIAAIIRLESKGPALFVQQRVGLGGKVFPLFKFRSMCAEAEALRRAVVEEAGAEDDVRFKWSADPRITRFGRLLRRFSLDELPQLLNVLRGEMSLVGPRPPIPEEVELYSPRQRGRLAVRPGLTCTWQIGGRAEIPFEGQVEMDLAYIEERSLGKDLKILLRTPAAVLIGRGAY